VSPFAKKIDQINFDQVSTTWTITHISHHQVNTHVDDDSHDMSNSELSVLFSPKTNELILKKIMSFL
jgi:hypothetical protein